MKNLALMAVNMWLSYLLVRLQLVASIVLILGALQSIHAAEFSCQSGDVTCLIAAINDANAMPGEHIINLDPGIYTLQMVDNMTDGANGLPSIRRSIRIQASADDPPTVIERDPNAPGFRIFNVSVGGALSLDGVTVQRGGGGLIVGAAILNQGIASLQDSIISDSIGEGGVIFNSGGTLHVFRSMITDNFGGHLGGAIVNGEGGTGGNVLVESSTIAHNAAIGAGGIYNEGSLVVKNSAIIFNSTDCCASGGGIGNFGGSVEIANSTIAKNAAGVGFGGGGGGIANFGGQVFITNSTIRENQLFDCCFGHGGGILNDSGTLRLQNTIVAGNILNNSFEVGADCFGAVTSIGNNLVRDPSGCAVNLQPTDLTGDPGLGALVGAGENDLPGAAYYPVLAGSVVIDRANPAACTETDQLGNPRVGTCDIGAVEFQGRMLVSVDVRPKKDANRINPNSSKNINVAIFSVNGFDATTVDSSTVRFGATGTEAVPVHVALRDLEGDGHRDMVLRFQIQDTGIRCGDISASLTGQIFNGPSIIGSSSIKTVQCGKQR